MAQLSILLKVTLVVGYCRVDAGPGWSTSCITALVRLSKTGSVVILNILILICVVVPAYKKPSLNGVPSWRLKDYVSKSSPGSLPSLTRDSGLTFDSRTHLTQLVCERINGRNIVGHVKSSLNSYRPQNVVTEIQVDELALSGPLSLEVEGCCQDLSRRPSR